MQETTGTNGHMRMDGGDRVGLVLGTPSHPATPLGFTTFVDEGRYLQLDDIVHVRAPSSGTAADFVEFFGIVDEVRAVQEGIRFDSDVALTEQGALPAGLVRTAHVSVTRVEPEILVPPVPGQVVWRARGSDRDRALFFDQMATRVPFGLSRSGEPIYAKSRFPQWDPRSAYQHLRCFRRRNEDLVRDVPAALAVRE